MACLYMTYLTFGSPLSQLILDALMCVWSLAENSGWQNIYSQICETLEQASWKKKIRSADFVITL